MHNIVDGHPLATYLLNTFDPSISDLSNLRKMPLPFLSAVGVGVDIQRISTDAPREQDILTCSMVMLAIRANGESVSFTTEEFMNRSSSLRLTCSLLAIEQIGVCEVVADDPCDIFTPYASFRFKPPASAISLSEQPAAALAAGVAVFNRVSEYGLEKVCEAVVDAMASVIIKRGQDATRN